MSDSHSAASSSVALGTLQSNHKRAHSSIAEGSQRARKRSKCKRNRRFRDLSLNRDVSLSDVVERVNRTGTSCDTSEEDCSVRDLCLGDETDEAVQESRDSVPVRFF